MSQVPTRIRPEPGRWIYVVAGVTLVLGLLLAAASAGLALRNVLTSFPAETTHIVAPGRTEITLEPGRYTIGYEYRTSLDGRTFNTPREFPRIELALVSAATGTAVPIHLSSDVLDYETDAGQGVELGEFHVERAGTYVLTSQYSGGDEGAQVVLAIGRSPDVTLLLELGVVLGILLAVAGASIGITWIVIRQRQGPVSGRSEQVPQAATLRWDGRRWVTADGRFGWDGAAWQSLLEPAVAAGAIDERERGATAAAGAAGVGPPDRTAGPAARLPGRRSGGRHGPPRYSDDRHWWWDGVRWTPASDAARRLVAAEQEPAAPPTRAPRADEALTLSRLLRRRNLLRFGIPAVLFLLLAMAYSLVGSVSIGTVFVVMGGGLPIGFALNERRRVRRRRRARGRAMGIVFALRERSVGEDSTALYPLVRWLAPEGRVHAFEHDTDVSLTVGEVVPVMYDRGNLEDALIESGAEIRFGQLLFAGAMGAIFVTVGLFMLAGNLAAP